MSCFDRLCKHRVRTPPESYPDCTASRPNPTQLNPNQTKPSLAQPNLINPNSSQPKVINQLTCRPPFLSRCRQLLERHDDFFRSFQVQSYRNMAHYKPQDLANTLWAMATLRLVPEPEWLAKATCALHTRLGACTRQVRGR